MASTLLTGLAEHWALNGSSWDQPSSLPSGGHALTQFGSVTFAAGKIGNGASFSGAGAQAAYAGRSNATSFTHAVWFKVTSTPGAAMPVQWFANGTESTEYSGVIGVSSAMKLLGHVFDGAAKNITGTTTLALNTWYHAVLTGTPSGAMILYLNGASQGSIAIGTPFTSWSSGPYLIHGGRAGVQFTTEFAGVIDESAYWTRVLSAAEVSQLYRLGAGNTYPFETLLLDMPMQDRAASSAVDDVSTADNNGALSVDNSEDISIDDSAGNELPYALDLRALNDISLQPTNCGRYYTLEWFMKPDAANSALIIFENLSGNSVLARDAAGNISLRNENEEQNEFTGPADANKHHFAIVSNNDNDEALLYLDGSLLQTIGLAGGDFLFNVIGGSFDGWIKGLKAYAEMRTGPQIRASYEAGVDAIEITSGTEFSVPENTTAIGTVTAAGGTGDTSFFAVGGDDIELGIFDLNDITGVISFNTPPDYETPLDANADNVYEVAVYAENNYGQSDPVTLLISVTNVSEGGGGGVLPWDDAWPAATWPEPTWPEATWPASR